MSNILIEANNISKIYGMDILLKRGNNFYALNNVDFVLQEGDFISVMGPSGSGKSTLLNCISTLDTVSKGSIKVLGVESTTMSDRELSAFRYESLGFIFQNHNLISTLSIFDNIATPVILGKMDPRKIGQKVLSLAKELNIEHILYKKPGECSGGEKQRVAIARALVNDPKILICDEPTGNLDSKNSHELLSLLSYLNKKGMSIVLVTHDNMIASYAKTFMYLRDGSIKTMLRRNTSSQVDFFNEIVKVTTQDSLIKLFNDKKKEPETSADAIVRHDISSTNVERQDYQNDVALKRHIVYAIFPSKEETSDEAAHYTNLKIDEKTLSYRNILNEDIEIKMQDIKEIKLSLCARHRSFGVFSEYMYYCDLDIITAHQTYTFELKNRNDLTPLFNLFIEQQIPIIDPVGVVQIYQTKSDYLQRHRYIQYRYKELAKKYNLDYPRTT